MKLKNIKPRRKNWQLGFLGFLGFLGVPALIEQDWINAFWILWFIWFIYFAPVEIRKK